MSSKSIRYYFFTSITTVLVASVLFLGLIQIFLSVGYFRSEKQGTLQQVVQVIAKGADALDMQSPPTTNPINYIAEITGSVVLLCNEDGVVQQAIGENAPPPGAQVSADILEMIDAGGEYNELGRLGGVYSTNHYSSGARLPAGYVFASSNVGVLRVYLMDTMSTFVLSAGLVLLISSIMALVLSNRTITPIRRLSEAAHSFTEGDYSARVPVEGDDELAKLSITFNEMAQSFEATDTSRRNFMGNIAHELRTPMTTIKGFIDGMLDGTIPVEQRDHYLAVVSDEVGRLARLTKNMLDISRLEAGEFSPNNTVFDIYGPMATVILGAEQRLLDKKLNVEGMEHEEPACVQADEDFVHQILYNVVDNAIKFAGEGGTITASAEKGKGVVTVHVRNTGSGIPQEALPHVFDRFYKADKSRGQNARGAGLGLHISKVLLNQMGGRIWAESEEGKWTEFSFTLPAAPPPKRGQRRKPPAKAPASGPDTPPQ